jgi:hypothetical protein
MKAVAILLACAALSGCDAGNYSNEDIDFQLAVPEREDIAVKLPAQSLEASDAAEHYRSTRMVVKSSNETTEAFLAFIDKVRVTPPSERNGPHRVWGPFPVDGSPQWLGRLVIDRVGNAGQPARFDYQVQFRAREAAAAPWGTLLAGNFTPGANARRGVGALHYDAAAARAAGFPLGGLNGIQRLDIEYKTTSFPVGVKMTVVNFPALESAVVEYLEEENGAGELLFTFPTPGLVGVSSLEIRSRWSGSGAGRADVKVLAGLPLLVGLKGTDCWGIDTRATYRYRDWDKANTVGSETSCVFPAP